jgi:hypothetical protein
MRRIACLVLCLAALAPAAPALAQSSPFGPLPPAAPASTPVPTPDNSSSVLGQDVGRKTLYAVAGSLLVIFVAIGLFISRDARRTLPSSVSEEAERRRADPKERHRREREKARARQKTRAQRAARKTTRRKAKRK